MMNWQIRSDQPIYAQLTGHVRRGIASGQYMPGERLPSVRDLAVEAGVNPNTMQRALSELERDGLVFSQRTSGRFVTEDKEMIEEVRRSLAAKYVKEFLSQMTRLGFQQEEIFSLLEEHQEERKEDGDGSL